MDKGGGALFNTCVMKAYTCAQMKVIFPKCTHHILMAPLSSRSCTHPSHPSRDATISGVSPCCKDKCISHQCPIGKGRSKGEQRGRAGCGWGGDVKWREESEGRGREEDGGEEMGISVSVGRGRRDPGLI